MKPKVLIVDDNSMMREVIRSTLETKFPALRVFEAGDGKEVSNLIRHQMPDLVLMDIELPGENGLDLTRTIKDLYPKISIIIFTSYDLPEYRKAAYDSGADLFLSKSSRQGKRLPTIVKSILTDAE